MRRSVRVGGAIVSAGPEWHYGAHESGETNERPTRSVPRPVELAPPCPKLRRYETKRGGWSIDAGGERVWDPALPPFTYQEEEPR